MIDLKRNWRIVVLVSAVIISLLLITTKGLSFGIDFVGGTEIKMELEKGGEQYADAVVEILKNRLNSMGLKSIQVLKEADQRHITIKVSVTSPEDIQRIKDIINQQAVFEQYVDGDLCARGDEIQLDTSAPGGAVSITGNTWAVSVRTSGPAPKRCGEAMKGRAGHMTDVFLDRPRDAFILLNESICNQLRSTPFKNHEDDTGYTELEFIERRANIPVICYAPSPNVNTSLAEELGLEINSTTLDINSTLLEIKRLHSEGKTEAILMDNTTIPSQVMSLMQDLNISVETYPLSPGQPLHEINNPSSWIDTVTGLKSTLRIREGLTYGNPIYSSVFTGGAGSPKEAREIAQQFQIWLTSGNLPVKTRIVMERPNLPEIGQEFFKYIGIIALIAIALVALVVSVRYRAPKISIFILLTSFSEIIIILGFASVSGWELDLAAMAGIIAAIGTGVDHQIIITDETLLGERKKEKRVWDIKNAINRAFFIIFTSAATTILAMLPLMSIIDLKGFAFTSIIGVLIGVFITRPAYGRIIELIT